MQTQEPIDSYLDQVDRDYENEGEPMDLELFTKGKLDQLANFREAVEAIQKAEQETIDRVYTEEIRNQVADITAEFAGKAQSAQDSIAKLEKEIKEAIVLHGATIKGAQLQAVFNKGRTKFDTASVKAYLKAQGIYDEYVTEGEPYASIRKV